MKIAIVGTSVKLTESEKNDIRASLIFVLSYYPAESIIISGGATGVDKLAIDVAKEVGFTTKDYLPEKNEWKYYKKRNLEIAQDCDELFCFSVDVRSRQCYHHETPQNHEKTAGCWTANVTHRLKKPTQLIVISKRK